MPVMSSYFRMILWLAGAKSYFSLANSICRLRRLRRFELAGAVDPFFVRASRSMRASRAPQPIKHIGWGPRTPALPVIRPLQTKVLVLFLCTLRNLRMRSRNQSEPGSQPVAMTFDIDVRRSTFDFASNACGLAIRAEAC